ncbi:hypothetical protein T484DRAFT_1981896 [Baffinella frigidus]|nr:hypothetical protein T484DRAFT_1981896 [Cryptophyta sp. CCMP2293]
MLRLIPTDHRTLSHPAPATPTVAPRSSPARTWCQVARPPQDAAARSPVPLNAPPHRSSAL